MNDTTVHPPRAPGGPTLTDLIFLASMVVMLILVSWVGHLSYLEGMKTEGTKRNGEAWAKWFADTGAERFKDDFGLLVCAGGPARAAAPAEEASTSGSTEAGTAVSGTASSGTTSPAAPNTRLWGDCLKQLITPPGSLAGLRNPFDDNALTFAPKCDTSDRSLTGALVLEKLMPTPPGSTVPFVASPLVESDAIEQKLLVRITVCDKGAYPIRVAEVEF